MSDIDKVDLSKFKQTMQALLNTMHFIECDFGFTPSKNHIGACINYSDLTEMRPQFIRELVNTVTTFVYSQEKQRKLLTKLKKDGRDSSGANRELYARARDKFRKQSLKGQFSELLLHNLLQHHFNAVPLLRKMPITTNPELERNGADAIHVARTSDGFVLFLGEAKTYNTKDGSPKKPFKDGVSDLVRLYKGHQKELTLYTYEDFIPKELENIASKYINGELRTTKVELVCIVSYDCVHDNSAGDRDQILLSITNQIKEGIKDTPLPKDTPRNLVARLNYIIFSINRLDELIQQFGRELGNV